MYANNVEVKCRPTHENILVDKIQDEFLVTIQDYMEGIASLINLKVFHQFVVNFIHDKYFDDSEDFNDVYEQCIRAYKESSN